MTLLVWISNRIHYMKKVDSHTLIHTIMAESKISVGDTSACNSRSCSEKDGTKVNVVIGEKEEDPVFAITDLLPHLGSKQMEKTAATVIEGEALDILVGSAPLCGEEKMQLQRMF